MSLTVLSVAYPFAPITDDPAGGAEQVLAQLDRALVGAGHRSIVLAQEGSHTAGELIAVPAPAGAIDAAAWSQAHEVMRRHIDRLSCEVDLVHFHGLDFAACPPPPGSRTLVTLHLPLDWYAPDDLRRDRPRTWLQPVSADQARRAAPGVELLAPIGNGVDLDRYRPVAVKGDYALILGRVAPEKGFHDAIAAARRAGVRLELAGRIFPHPAHERYFAEEVAPHLDQDRRSLGPVFGAAKQKLLAQALCLLAPFTAAETSSLVAMEAMASGTPVIAYRSGALPDIVEDGVTGILVDDVAGLAAAIGRIGEIDPAMCRRRACERFSLDRVAGAYLDLYGRLAA